MPGKLNLTGLIPGGSSSVTNADGSVGLTVMVISMALPTGAIDTLTLAGVGVGGACAVKRNGCGSGATGTARVVDPVSACHARPDETSTSNPGSLLPISHIAVLWRSSCTKRAYRRSG